MIGLNTGRFHQLINDIVSLLLYSVAVHVLKLYNLKPSPTQTVTAWIWQGARACTRATYLIAASNNCHRLLKTQGTVGSKFDNPTEMSIIIQVHSSWLLAASVSSWAGSGRCSSSLLRFIFSFLSCKSLLLRRHCRVWINLSAIDIVNHWIHNYVCAL